MNSNCASVAPGGLQHHDEQPLPIPKACALRRREILELVGAYAGGQVVRGGQEDLFEKVLGLDPTRDNDAPSLVVLAWDINVVRAELACVVDPGSPHPWLLRIEMTDGYIALALNWAGPGAGVPWQHFYTGMADIVNFRPLAATIMFHAAPDPVWLRLLDNLGNHFGVLVGATVYWWPPCIIPWSLEIDMCDPGPEIDMTGIDNWWSVGDDIPQGGISVSSLRGAFQQDSAPTLAPAHIQPPPTVPLAPPMTANETATDQPPPVIKRLPEEAKTQPKGTWRRAAVVPFNLLA